MLLHKTTLMIKYKYKKINYKRLSGCLKIAQMSVGRMMLKLRKQELKLLVLSGLDDFSRNDILEELDRYSRRHYDMVIVMGDITDNILTALESQYETSLIALLPDKKPAPMFGPNDGAELANKRKYRYSSHGSVICYNSKTDGKPADIYKLEKYKADVLVSSKPPVYFNLDKAEADEKKRYDETLESVLKGEERFTSKDEELVRNIPKAKDKNADFDINRYIAYQNPLYLIHGGRKNNDITVTESGTTVISVYGIREIHLNYKKYIC